MTEKEIIQIMIEKSLDMLYQSDHYLIWNCKERQANHVSEPGIAFRFGIYFDALARKNFPRFQVDVEYNRNIVDLKVLPSRPNGSYPDLILHKRGRNSGNLLVVELKTWWNSDQNEDYKKVVEFCAPSGIYCYKYGVLLLIGKTRDKVKITFFTHDEKGHLCEDILNPTTKTQSSNFFRSN